VGGPWAEQHDGPGRNAVSLNAHLVLGEPAERVRRWIEPYGLLHGHPQ
jgi:hypothetical protein